MGSHIITEHGIPQFIASWFQLDRSSFKTQNDKHFKVYEGCSINSWNIAIDLNILFFNILLYIANVYLISHSSIYQSTTINK